MVRFFQASADRATPLADAPGTPIPFVAASEGIKRDGLNLRMSGALLDNYRANPVVLWGHDYTGERLPIGRAEVDVDGETLRALVTFDQEDDFAREVERKYRRGYLHTVSIGWRTLEQQARDVTRWDLLDISGVPVPGDPQALIQRAADVAAPAWPEVAADMVALYLYPTSRSPRAWRSAYTSLARAYQDLGKEPPERLAPDYLAALDTEALAGLFLEDEAEAQAEAFKRHAAEAEGRAGKVLSRQNMADLEEIIRLASGIIDRAKKEPPTPDDDTPRAQPELDESLVRLARILRGEQ